MSQEISLSLEETNKLRASLGLKLIEPESKQDDDKGTGNTKLEDTPPAEEEPQFIDHDKAYALRKKLATLRKGAGMGLSNNDNESSSQGDWLSRIGSKPVKISFDEDVDEEVDDMPLMKVSHKIEEIAGEKDMILTLKESSVLAEQDDDEDALENENLTHDKEQAKNIHLRQVNKDRRRMKKKLQVSSAEIQEDEDTQDDGSMLVIGAAKRYDTEPKETESKHTQGKLKVSFKGADSDESDGGDFKPVQIKKRKRKGTGSRIKSSITLPSQIKEVKLRNYDLNDEGLEEDLFVSVKRTRLRSETSTPEDLAAQLSKEKQEREERAARVAKSSDNLVIDESTRFLESLKNTVLEPTERPEETPSDELHTETTKTITEPVPEVQREPDFYNGLASTLSFVKQSNVLPKLQSIPSKTSNPITPDYDKEAQKIRQRSRNKMGQDRSQYSAKELEEIERYQDDQIARHVNKLQSQRLQDYDPEVKLDYRDEKGNQLTTKEAYKKLSQKFHGTRSNQKKQAKAQSRIEARKAQQQNASVFDVL